MGAWTEEPNAIVDVTRDGKTTPNLRATTEGLENDIAVRSVNAAPTAAADRAALIDRLAPVLPGDSITRFSYGRAGRPSKARSAPWPASAASIRTIARGPTTRSSTCAAICLSSAAVPWGSPPRRPAAGAVSLIDGHSEIGGQLVHRGGLVEGGDWRDWASVVHAVEAAGGRVMTRTTAYGVYDGNLVCAWERCAPAPDALWRIRPQKIVVAAGAIERPLIVPDNDGPA